MSIAYADEAVRIHELGHLTDGQIAAATGAARSTVRGWLRRASSPTSVRAERVAELGAIVDRLARVVRPEYIPVWLAKPVEALDDEKPLDLVARGDYARVLALIRSLEYPGAV